VSDLVLLRVPLGDGSDDFIEVHAARPDVTGPAGQGVVLASDDEQQYVATGYTFIEATKRVVPALRGMVTSLRDTIAPDELTLEFGLQAGGETGFILAKGTTEVNVSVSMTWRRGAKE
jgi:hypothetical protein